MIQLRHGYYGLINQITETNTPKFFARFLFIVFLFVLLSGSITTIDYNLRHLSDYRSFME